MNKIYFIVIIVINTSCNNYKDRPSIAKDFSFISDSLNIQTKLSEHKLRGFSIAVFENYRIVHKQQWGVKAANNEEEIDENTAFSTASISKPVTALLCLILEEKGLINLDEPIEKYLKRWQLPESKFTSDIEITWKHLLSHTAGTSQHGFADYYEGDTIPSIVQSLKGQLPRYNDKEIEFLFVPGTSWKYSGGGYVIVQMALEDHFKKTISELAKEYIFDPLNLVNSSMIQPNEKGFLSNVAKVHDEHGNVIKTGLPITPQVAPSGMWSTPTDLAKLTIEIQNALRNKGNTLISHEVAKKTTEIAALKDAVGGWSLGWQLSFGYDNYNWFQCNGSNTGVGGDVFATIEDGNGFVIFANGEKANRFPVIDYTRNTLLRIMKWRKVIPRDNIKPLPTNLQNALVGTYDDFLYQQSFETTIITKNNRLYVQSPFFEHFKGTKESEMVYLGDNVFKIIDYPNFLKLEMDETGQAINFIIYRDSLDTLAVTIPLIKKENN
ncbi:CubicO group peptidase, beta-lactamase class C family [Marivirga sericea]|uniref:CubicO group peptidase, beta-lactamase class C family n=1 Tax=Marivirga sericea TaxID=1028 RepID=A0A1X7JLM5_9BACT|nr:serine hydrolase domain-containing protein [Marivirga sericea]SMG29104.1 CubicO group peptidase, beta-lactamase class C family [Marivirga sericea]